MERRILTYRLFEEQNIKELTQEQIEWLDLCTREGRWELNPDTGLVDSDGDFYCHRQGLTDLNGVSFGTVEYFNCADNQLTSLKGAPKIVNYGFYCEGNQLTSLEGAPEKVGGDFSCNHNQLTSLVGSPKEVGGYFFCHNNQLTSLKGAPEKIGGPLYCSDNPVGYETLVGIYDLMKSGRSYPEALSEYWNQMPDKDKDLMYTDNPDLSPDERKGYELRDKVSKRIY